MNNSSYAGPPVNEDIIHQTEGPFQALKYLGHGALEDLRGGADTKWEFLKQKRPNGVTKVASSFDLASKGICRKLLLASSSENILLSPSLARFSSNGGIACISRWTALLRWVRYAHCHLVWNDTCTPFSWRCYRRDHSLLKHSFYLTFYLSNQWMGNLSGIVETETPRIRAKCYVAFSLRLSQSAEEC